MASYLVSKRSLDLSFQHLHHLEDETAGRPEEGKTSSTKSRRYFGWLNKDLGAERANACVLGVEAVHFVDRMGEAGPNTTGNNHRDPFAQDKRRTDLSKEGHLAIEVGHFKADVP